MTEMLRYLVTGAAGQLGYGLWQALSADEKDMCKSHESYDITDLAQVAKWTPTLNPDAIINCAAYNYTDSYNLDRQYGWQVNVRAAANLARVAAEHNFPFIQLSANTIFGQDLSHTKPYTEQDTPGPSNELGNDKLAIEHVILRLAQEYPDWPYFIVRTANLFEPPWREYYNLPRNILQSIRSRQMTGVPIVDRVFTSITYVPHLVPALVWFADHAQHIPRGIYHVANEGACTPFQVATVVARAEHKSEKLRRITREEHSRLHNLSSLVPPNTVLSTDKYAQLGGPKLPNWLEAVSEWADAATTTKVQLKGTSEYAGTR